MKWTDLAELPVEVTQLTPLHYGSEHSDTLGAAISFKAVVEEGAIEFDSGNGQASFWGEDDAVTEIAKIMAGKAYEVDNLEMRLSLATSNGDAVFETEKAHKLKVGSATPKADRKIEYKFSISFYTIPGNLDAVHKCMKRDDLKLSTDG